MSTIIDTNALVYLSNKNHEFYEPCIKLIERHKRFGPILVCDIVYCEFSVMMSTKKDTDKFLSSFYFDRIKVSDDALFIAGKAFLKYRNNRRKNRSSGEGDAIEEVKKVLPDFYVGGIAEFEKTHVLTADDKHYRNWFNIKNISKISLIEEIVD